MRESVNTSFTCHKSCSRYFGGTRLAPFTNDESVLCFLHKLDKFLKDLSVQFGLKNLYRKTT